MHYVCTNKVPMVFLTRHLIPIMKYGSSSPPQLCTLGKPPFLGWVKINFDAAIRESSSFLSVLCRDSHDYFVYVYTNSDLSCILIVAVSEGCPPLHLYGSGSWLQVFLVQRRCQNYYQFYFLTELEFLLGN